MTGASEGGLRARAEQRLEILARQLERVGLADLQVVTNHNEPGRDAIRRRATEAAVETGDLGDLLADARNRFWDWVQSAYNRLRSDPYWAQVGGPAQGPVDDRISVFWAVDDAVLATVTYELISEEDRETLLEPYARMMAFGS
ncbi:MAG: hypothetical protein ABI628_12865 [Chloroflexota bacterium]